MTNAPTPPEIPEDLHRLMAEIGPKWNASVHMKAMADAFDKLHAKAPKLGRVTCNIAYGTHPRQVLDVYEPLERTGAAPAVIFLHGGGFTDGEKDRSPEIFANVGWYLARHGIVCLNMEYRLAPESRYPGGTEDVRAAVAWTRENAGRVGIDASRIFLMGHSAGGAHVAHYAYDKRFHPPGGPGVAGAIIASGRVRAEMRPENVNAKRVEAYYGSEAAMQEGSGVNHVGPDSVPTLIAVAEYENPLLDMHCAELYARLSAAKKRSPAFVWLRGHNHASIVAHINTAEDRLGREILAFIANGR